MSGDAAWKTFEKLISTIQQRLAPTAIVRHDHRMRGKSGSLLQLDISITQQVGSFTILVVLECKRYTKRPVLQREVRDFHAKLSDIGAVSSPTRASIRAQNASPGSTTLPSSRIMTRSLQIGMLLYGQHFTLAYPIVSWNRLTVWRKSSQTVRFLSYRYPLIPPSTIVMGSRCRRLKRSSGSSGYIHRAIDPQSALLRTIFP